MRGVRANRLNPLLIRHCLQQWKGSYCFNSCLTEPRCILHSVYPDPAHLISICTVCHAVSESTVLLIGPVKQKLFAYYCDYFLIHQLKHVFWVPKRTVSSRRSFEYPQHMFWLRNKKNNFQLRTLIWGPALVMLNPDLYLFFEENSRSRSAGF